MWNQVPSTLEILVSEEQFDNEKTGTNNTMTFHRRTNTILPGVGCGLDNLHTNQSDEKYSYNFNNDDDGNDDGDGIVMIHSNNNNHNNNDDDNADNNKILRIWHDDKNSASTFDSIIRTAATATATATAAANTSKTKTRTLRLETMFLLPNDHRLRVSLDLNVLQIITNKTNGIGNGCTKYCYKLSSTSSIKIQWERCYNNNNKAVGGGSGIDGNGHLDAGTVYSLIGEELRNHRNQITATATASIMDNNDKDNNNNCIEHQQINDTTTLHLPGNIMVSTGYIGDDNNNNNDEWYIDISLLCFPSLDMISIPTSTTNNTAKSTTKETTTTTLRTIRRKFQDRIDDGCCLIISYI